MLDQLLNNLELLVPSLLLYLILLLNKNRNRLLLLATLLVEWVKLPLMLKIDVRLLSWMTSTNWCRWYCNRGWTICKSNYWIWVCISLWIFILFWVWESRYGTCSLISNCSTNLYLCWVWASICTCMCLGSVYGRYVSVYGYESSKYVFGISGTATFCNCLCLSCPCDYMVLK